MAGLARFIRIMVTLILVTMARILGFIVCSSDPDDTSIGPYQDFVVDDVSKPQTFTIPARIIPPVVVRYRIAGVVDDCAGVSFRMRTYPYGQVKFKGVGSDSAVRDFYAMSDL